ncbi:MAG: glycosyltransferase family 2 protein [Flavisolibacter sp.]
MKSYNEHNTPLVSIIMPSYNHDKYIAETIESIRQQTYTNWELIIVDDGSNDTTEEIINAIKDQRIKFYKAGRINVAGIIKNIGLSKTKGEFIAFIDSDDLWESTKIEKQLVALEEYPDAGFCMTGGYNFSTITQPIEYYYKQKSGLNYGHIFVPLLKSEVAGFIQVLLFRKYCLDKTGEFKTHKPFSDIDFILSLAWHYKGVIIYEPLLKRRIHQSNHSFDNWMVSYSNTVDMIDSFKDRIPPSLRKEVLFKMHINEGEGYVRRGQKSNAIKKYFKAWYFKPLSIVPIKKIIKAVIS